MSNIKNTLTINYKCIGKWGKNSKTNIYLVYCNLKHLEKLRIKMFFFVKNFPRIVWTVLASFFLSYNMKQASSLCLDELSCSFLSLDQLPTFYSLDFKPHEISLRIPLMWSFLLVSLPLGHFHPFCAVTNHQQTERSDMIHCSWCTSKKVDWHFWQ